MPCAESASAKQDWTTKQAALNVGWVLPVFVHLRVANHLFFALKSKDSEKGEIVIASVRFFCETANRCIADTVRWGVRIFIAALITLQNCKVDRWVFRCGVCSTREKQEISLYSQKNYILGC